MYGFGTSCVALCEELWALFDWTCEGRLLDSLIFTLGSGLSSGELHVYTNLPTVIAGTAGGMLRTGQHVRYAEGTPVANLWLSMAQLFGDLRQSLGDSTGVLKEVTG